MKIAILGSLIYQQEKAELIKYLDNLDTINHHGITPQDIDALAQTESKNAKLSQALKSYGLAYIVTGSERKKIRNEINNVTLLYVHILREYQIPVWMSHEVNDLDESLGIKFVSLGEIKELLPDFIRKTQPVPR